MAEYKNVGIEHKENDINANNIINNLINSNNIINDMEHKFDLNDHVNSKITHHCKGFWACIEELRRITRIGAGHELKNEEYETIVKKIYELNMIHRYQNMNNAHEPHPFIKLFRDIGDGNNRLNGGVNDNSFEILYGYMELLFDIDRVNVPENELYDHIYLQWQERAVDSALYRMLWRTFKEYDIFETFIQDFLISGNNRNFINNLF